MKKSERNVILAISFVLATAIVVLSVPQGSGRVLFQATSSQSVEKALPAVSFSYCALDEENLDVPLAVSGLPSGAVGYSTQSLDSDLTGSTSCGVSGSSQAVSPESEKWVSPASGTLYFYGCSCTGIIGYVLEEE